MGRRTKAAIEFVRFLRTTDPKYSFEILVFNLCLLITSNVLLIMDEYKLYAITSLMLLLSIGIQMLRIRRVIKRKLRGLEEHVMQSTYLQAQHAAAEKKNNPNRHAAENARLIALLKEDVEQAMREKRMEG